MAQNLNPAVNAMHSIGQRRQETHIRIREMLAEEVERRVAHTVLRLPKAEPKAPASISR